MGRWTPRRCRHSPRFGHLLTQFYRVSFNTGIGTCVGFRRATNVSDPDCPGYLIPTYQEGSKTLCAGARRAITALMHKDADPAVLNQGMDVHEFSGIRPLESRPIDVEIEQIH